MDSSDMLRANFEQLRLRYYEGTRAPWAAEMLEDSRQTGFLLSLSEGSEDGSEVEKSPIFKAFDDLLAYYSIIEVASMAGCMPEPLPEEIRRSVQTASSSQDLFRLCMRQGRLLPLMLGAQLGEGGFNSSRKPSDEGRRAFAAFLDVNAMIEEDPEVEIFFRYLSREELDGYDLHDLVSLTRRPQELLRRLAQQAGSEGPGPDGLDMALHGFRSFLIFSHRLDSLIRNCSDDPILRSAFWHFHADRFDRRGSEIRTFVGLVLDNLRAWAEPAKAEMLGEDKRSGVSREESIESLEECRWMIARLTSNLYKRPLQEISPFGYSAAGPGPTPAGGLEEGGGPQEGAEEPRPGRPPHKKRSSEPEGAA